jgi:hypothetical protein
VYQELMLNPIRAAIGKQFIVSLTTLSLAYAHQASGVAMTSDFFSGLRESWFRSIEQSEEVISSVHKSWRIKILNAAFRTATFLIPSNKVLWQRWLYLWTYT